MNYKGLTVEEFVLDKNFREWVLEPNAENNLFWQTWLRRNPEKKEVLQEARSIILKMPRINYGWNNELEDALWQGIQQNTQRFNPDDEPTEKEYLAKVIPLHSAAVLGSYKNQSPDIHWSYQWIGRIAATILLVLTVGIAGYLGSREQSKQELQPVTYLTKETPLGTKARFKLPDGTKVVLNAGSTIYYPDRFSETERLVEIQGEAFLEIAKDTLKPFRVKTGSVVTEALGTAFNVKYEQKAVQIALVEGKVLVSMSKAGKTEAEVILAPGEQAFLQDNQYLIKEAFDLQKLTAWKEGVLIFDGVGEKEFIRRLERWYGVEISTKGTASKVWNFSGRFKDKSLEYVLKAVGFTMDFSFTIEEKKVKIIYS